MCKSLHAILITNGKCSFWLGNIDLNSYLNYGVIDRKQDTRCTKTMHFNNAVCTVKHINADHLESLVVGKLSELSQNEAYLKMSVAEMNGDLKRKMGPLQKDAQGLRTRLKQIEQEIGRYVKALGQGKLSVGRLETEIAALEIDRDSLQKQLDELDQKINESAIRDYNAELLQRTLQDFRTAFTSLTLPEQSEALQCVLKRVTVSAQKLTLEVFELEEFHPSSQNRKEWLALADDFRTLDGVLAIPLFQN